MTEHDPLARRFEAERPRLHALAYRMLGSAAEAEDAVQEAWLRLGRASVPGNLAAWLTTVVSRLCLDVLRARRETPVAEIPETPDIAGSGSPEDEIVLAGEVGRALLVVLDRLGPAERAAFVLHDLFAMPFDEVGPILDRSPATAKKLASRARLRVRGTPSVPDADLTEHRAVVTAFLAAARGGDLAALLEVLAPDVVRYADPATLPPGVPAVLRGRAEVARGTTLFAGRAQLAEPALVNGDAGLVLAPGGRLAGVLKIQVRVGLVAAYEVVVDPRALAEMDIALLSSPAV
ncbi:sigma-70 family RNA polymerase sigma factor [Amycolatopsis jiangsuensis]|uniref:RNA polymerase sigma-70 factor (ECF subfamily) n=1 Tax=Amycolatopsis jiangsuensis TaxID=1181879 RepID=A0A840IQ25_9PSEU|nr:sigma-70 family RNA polymerase sigma factor [Amycolatopsis jiangsuensis]MBB4683292.1 RNA polymerase sigma-70 factor (ECF subfamily) [Amycolatopsis jiangsuensis]